MGMIKLVRGSLVECLFAIVFVCYLGKHHLSSAGPRAEGFEVLTDGDGKPNNTEAYFLFLSLGLCLTQLFRNLKAP